MTDRNLFETLCVGQSNLDLMKMRIFSTITQLLGLLHFEKSAWVKGEAWKFDSAMFSWELRVLESALSKPKFSLVCFKKWEGGGRSTCFSLNWNEIPLQFEDVELVYDDMNTFVNHLFQTFPGLEARVESIVMASQRTF